jgi:hypothetical protein
MVRNQRTLLIWFLGVAAAMFALAIWEVVGLPWRARIFPQTVAALGLALSVLALVHTVRSETRPVTEGASPPGDPDAARPLTIGHRHMVWVLTYFAAIVLAGFPAASAICVSLFLWREDRMPWRFAMAAGAVVAVALALLTRIARMPQGWLLG